MTEHQADSSPSDVDLDQLRGSNGVLAVTDDGTEPILAAVRTVAARIAAALDTTLFLADRSTRTWTETPHVRGPATIDELREHGVDYMVTQMQEAVDAGVPNVMGLAPSIPNFDALLDSLEATHAEVVVAPVRLEHLRLFDRLQLRGDLIDAVKQRIGSRHLIAVDGDGSARLV